jgi:hypothetical protein
MAHMNALSSDRMTASERLSEIARILAIGLIRLRARQSTELSAQCGESFVDFLADRRGHADRHEGEAGR